MLTECSPYTIRQARPAAPGDTAAGLSGATFCDEKKKIPFSKTLICPRFKEPFPTCRWSKLIAKFVMVTFNPAQISRKSSLHFAPSKCFAVLT